MSHASKCFLLNRSTARKRYTFIQPSQTSPQKKLVPLGDVVGVFVARAYASACARAVEHAHMHCVVKLKGKGKHEGKSQSELENLLICYISNVFTCTSVVSL